LAEKDEKRKKRPVVTSSPKIPAPKRIPGGRPLQPRYEKPEKPEGTAGVAPSKVEIPPPKPGKTPDRSLSGHWVELREPEQKKEKPKPNVKMNLLAALVAGLITFGVLAGVLWSQGFFGGGGGGGGGGTASYDGTYHADTTTVTPIGTTYGSGTFTVTNGYVSEGNFTGTVDASGYFTGTMANVSPGSPTLTMTGQFSLTSTFTLYGSSGNTSYTISAYKIA